MFWCSSIVVYLSIAPFESNKSAGGIDLGCDICLASFPTTLPVFHHLLSLKVSSIFTLYLKPSILSAYFHDLA